MIAVDIAVGYLSTMDSDSNVQVVVQSTFDPLLHVISTISLSDLELLARTTK